MLCQRCNQKEANVHITKIINGVKTELHLCDECAKQSEDINVNFPINFGMPMSFQNILDGFVEMLGGAPKTYEEEVCPVCKMTFNDFRNKGRLGCGRCYSAFSQKITPIIKRVHGNIEHTGKVPARTGGELKLRRDIQRLKEELKIAINKEEYEKAAKLRDEIRYLESKLGTERGE
ncbi:protein-arginine kinase activator protein McsA [Thermobrachium celere]|uniref:Nucleotide excision repair protein, with UvrB/UvrC motif n=1 Tax=Thermobrachium celere DSM 8682 TaxID=941824 RepID=R7RRV5_9CLOT|nr:protein-arginine kinase activator protein McsA [Thermobrachium celere]GFR34930.1 excinuclease Uvr [Thermobrachium celere]CDF58932.1 Nucleotide excision repair protein, with UvrB/UvrC motif [Thermobrachium celere DSM 8682]